MTLGLFYLLKVEKKKKRERGKTTTQFSFGRTVLPGFSSYLSGPSVLSQTHFLFLKTHLFAQFLGLLLGFLIASLKSPILASLQSCYPTLSIVSQMFHQYLILSMSEISSFPTTLASL